MTVLFANRARSTLAGGINNVATSLNLQSGEGALFPNPSGGDYFSLVLGDGTLAGAYEVCYCTARSGDTLTVTRAQEGTTAQTWSAGSRADNLMTAGTMQAIQNAASGQSQSSNYGADTGSANAMVVALSPPIGTLAALEGVPIRFKKSANANTGNVTLNVDGLGALSVLHADGSEMSVGELPASGLIEVNNNGTNFVLMSVTHTAATVAEVEAGTDDHKQLTPANIPYSDSAIKAWVAFHWTGAAVAIDGSHNVSGVTRSGAGHYVVSLSGGFTFSFGLAIGVGKGPNPATAGSLAMGSIFSGTNPSVDVYTGDAGGSGGQASDPTSAVCFLFIGNTSN